MIRVGHFVSFGIGGADRAALELIRELSKNLPGIQICYNEMSFPTRTDDQDPSQGLLNIYDEYKSIGELHKISSTSDLAGLQLDVLHTHRSGEDEWLIPGLANLVRDFKIVETNFHGFLNTPADFRIYPSLALPGFRKVDLTENCAVIPNIVNSFCGNSLRLELGIPEEIIVYGRVGRSDKSIYSATLLKSYSKVENRHTALVWIGKSIQAVSDAKSLGLQNIIWIDPVSDPIEMANYYATFDVFCHANPLGETFGNTVAEAVLRGIPVASLRGSRKYPQAQRELLNFDQYCTNPRSFRALLERYRDEPDLREEAGSANSNYAELFLRPDGIAEKVMKVYEKVLS